MIGLAGVVGIDDFFLRFTACSRRENGISFSLKLLSYFMIGTSETLAPI